GVGMGFVSVSSLVLIQEIVQWSQRGSATASTVFARNIGSTLGATIFGAVLNVGLSNAAGVGAVSSDQLRQLLEDRPDKIGNSADILLALHHALHLPFWAMLLISLAIVFVAMLVPPITVERAHPSGRG